MRPTLRLDISDVERAFRSLEKRARALGPVFRELKGPLRADQKAHQDAETGPDGKWPQRSAATIEKLRAQRRRGRPLGRLPSSTTYTSGNFGLVGESRVPWSGAHQAGAHTGRGAKLPARPFLWLSKDMVARAVGRIERALVEAFGRR